jgi:hypothetical protein
MRYKHIILMLLLAFIGGTVMTAWVAKQYGWLSLGGSDNHSAQAESVSASPAPLAVVPVAPAPLASPVSPAQVATGNDTRAEAVITAISVRRTLEKGLPLGSLAYPLQAQFANRQPAAVATLLSIADKPVSLRTIQSGFDEISTKLDQSGSKDALWPRLLREMNELFVLRKDGTAAPSPQQRSVLVARLVSNGEIARAAKLVENMPGAANATQWLSDARNYIAMETALDIIEKAALAATVALPAPPVETTGSGVEELTPVSPIPAEPSDPLPVDE